MKKLLIILTILLTAATVAAQTKYGLLYNVAQDTKADGKKANTAS